MAHDKLDATASLDTLEIRLAPAWGEWSRFAARILMFLAYIVLGLGAAWVMVLLGLGWIPDWLEGLSLIPALLVALPLILIDLVIVGTLSDLVEHAATTWRPSMTLGPRTVRLGQGAPIPLSAVRDWSVAERQVRINDQRVSVRLSASERDALSTLLGRAVAHNQPDGPVGEADVPKALKAMRVDARSR